MAVSLCHGPLIKVIAITEKEDNYFTCPMGYENCLLHMERSINFPAFILRTLKVDVSAAVGTGLVQ